MSILKVKTDGGQGGGLGHSNMDHWEFNDEVKAAARKRRRLTARLEIAHGWSEYTDSQAEDSDDDSRERNRQPLDTRSIIPPTAVAERI